MLKFPRECFSFSLVRIKLMVVHSYGKIGKRTKFFSKKKKKKKREENRIKKKYKTINCMYSVYLLYTSTKIT